MPFGQKRLLSAKQEKKLKIQLIELRAEGLSAPKIAEKLKFGKSGVYQKLNSNHVYHYIKEFNLKRKKIRKSKRNEMDDKYKNLYFKYRKGMPECVVDSLRKEKFLLNDPEKMENKK